MKKRIEKIDPKSLAGITLRRAVLDFLNRLNNNAAKSPFSKLVFTAENLRFFWESLSVKPNFDIPDNFIKNYFRGICKFTNRQIDYKEPSMCYEVVLIDKKKFFKELIRYWDDLISYGNPYSFEKQKKIIGEIISKQYKKNEKNKILLNTGNINWQNDKFSKLIIFTNIFKVLKDFEKSKLINIDKVILGHEPLFLDSFPSLAFQDYDHTDDCQIFLPPDFTCEIEITLTKKGIKDLTKYEAIAIKDIEGHKTDNQSFTFVEGKMGFFQWNKNASKIKIGSTETRKFRLLTHLCVAPETEKITDTVFESIKLQKDYQDSKLLDSATSNNRKKELIEYTVKELQKINGLTGRIKCKINNKRVKLELY